jgi:hypothetical protein
MLRILRPSIGIADSYVIRALYLDVGIVIPTRSFCPNLRKSCVLHGLLHALFECIIHILQKLEQNILVDNFSYQHESKTVLGSKIIVEI